MQIGGGKGKYKKLSFASHFASQGYASDWYRDAPREKMKMLFEILCAFCVMLPHM